MQNKTSDTMLSVVIPVYNESESIAELHGNLTQELKDQSYEIIFVDDGSNDNTWDEISKLENVKSIRLRKNFGKSYALDAAIKKASGDVVVTMDGDLQDDPKEISRLLEKLNEGFDMVVGRKKLRKDPLEKTLPSKLFNFVVRRVFGLKIHDFNCGLKVFKKKIFDKIDLYGELHRYIPVLANSFGYKVTELPVEHHQRKYGKSKFGWPRYVRGFLDLFTVLTITRFDTQPGYLFGGIGVITGGLGFIMLSYLTGVWFFTDDPIGNRPLLLLGILLEILAVQSLCFGMLAELIVKRTQHDIDEIIEDEVL